jgi:NAD-dependent deacetylase
VAAAKRIFVLTGAGVSAESGLGTFRDPQGIWAKFNPLELATPEAFARDPAKVNAFYNLRRRNLLEASPNAAHAALARLERALAGKSGRLTLVTQNVDDLHERAGSRGVIHMHGELLRARCAACAHAGAWTAEIEPGSTCAGCGAVGAMRPDVVWFGEMPLHYDAIETALVAADLFVSIGTSGAVYPAAGLVADARARGIATLELNLEPSDGAALFDEGRYGPASQVVPVWVDELLGRGPTA